MQLSNRAYGYLDIVRLPLRCAPAPTLALILLGLGSCVVPVLEVLYIAQFLDTATMVVTGGAPASAVLQPIALVVLTVAWGWSFWHICALLVARIRMRCRDTLRTALTERRARLRYRYIEDADAWDLIERVCKEPEAQATDALNTLLQFIGMILRIVGLLTLLFTHVWWAALIIVGITVPLVIMAAKGGKASYQAERDNTKIKRRYEYLSDVLMGREAAPERSLFRYGSKLNEEYREEYYRAYRHSYSVRKKWFMRRGVSGLVFTMVAVVITLVLLPPTLSGALSFGLFMSLTNAVTDMVNWVAWSLGWQIDAIAKRRESLRDLSAFLALEEREGALDLPAPPLEFERLELRGVRFAYPGTDREILKGLDLTIEKGGHYAFVGVNGAGKTTITRILTGLYDEYEGEILLNGRDLRSYTQAELKGCFSIIYQDFAKYITTARANIAFEMPEREAALGDALQTVGLIETIAALPQGIDTPLGKIENTGQDVSGGEWQRLAMARAVANPAPVRILDEPTAALDPISESRVYSEFESISKGRTTVFISHRLGSTALADTIYVLGDGVVLEEGTHGELMDKNGLYADMYASQRSWYE